jgi:hypothetical protein
MIVATTSLLAVLATANPSPQAPAAPDDTTIALERTACFGTCPVYAVTIDAHGNVVYNGTRFVAVTGRRTARVPVARVAEILERAEQIRFFDLDDQYREIRHPDGTMSTVTDLPTTFVTIKRAGRSKRVEDYYGAPKALGDLERLIDDLAQTRQWVSTEENTPDRR